MTVFSSLLLCAFVLGMLRSTHAVTNSKAYISIAEGRRRSDSPRISENHLAVDNREGEAVVLIGTPETNKTPTKTKFRVESPPAGRGSFMNGGGYKSGVLEKSRVSVHGDPYCRYSPNRLRGIHLLIISGVLLMVQLSCRNRKDVQEEEKVHEGPSPRAPLWSLTGLAQVLNGEDRRSALLLLAIIPLWQGAAFAGALRIFLTLFPAYRRQPPNQPPSLSGLVETFAPLAVLLAQIIPLDIVLHFAGSDFVHQLSPGLLLSGLLLLGLSSFERSKWEQRRKEEEQRKQQYLMRIEKLPLIREE